MCGALWRVNVSDGSLLDDAADDAGGNEPPRFGIGGYNRAATMASTPPLQPTSSF